MGPGCCLHLRYAGRLEGVNGIVFGDMRQCVTAEEQEYLEGAILHALRDFDGPVAIGLRSGHVDKRNITLPLGASCQTGSDGWREFADAISRGSCYGLIFPDDSCKVLNTFI